MKYSFYLLVSLQLLNALLAIDVNNANKRFNLHQIESRRNQETFDHELSLDEESLEPIRHDRTVFDLDEPQSHLVHRGLDFSDTGCANNPCLNEGICTATKKGFECKCPWGWTGSRCEICLTECASNPCPANKKCKAKYGGGFECVCPADRVGVDCEIQNDLCSSNPCLNDGVCKPIEGGSFTCVCQKPWAGENCEKIWENPCTEETLRSNEMVQFRDPWERTSYLVCTDINIYHSMSCSVGTYFNEKLHHCVPEGYDPPVCPDKHCKNDADCILDENNNFRCLCKKGFKGELCEENIDECALGGDKACAGGVCVDQVNGYYCSCSNGIGLDCKTTIVNPCSAENMADKNEFHELKSSTNDVYLHCVSENTFVVNKCPENLFWHPEEKTCTLEMPLPKSGMCLSFPCKNGGECHSNQDGTFSCVCKNGFTGQFCEDMINLCESNPCQHGGRCLPYAGGYTCVCPDKIIDECCCHGILNPCPPKSKLIPGVNNYFPHLFPTRYIHCDFDGRAFARNCANGLRWNQELLSCMPGDVKIDPIDGLNANRSSLITRIRPVSLPSVSAQPVSVTPVVVSPVFATTVVTPVVVESVRPIQTGIPKLAPFNQPSVKKNQASILPQQQQPQYTSYDNNYNNNYHEYSYAARQDNLLRDAARSSFQSVSKIELDEVEDQNKQSQELQKQQEQILQQQQLVQQQQLQQQQQLEQQQQRDREQQERDKKQQELEKQRQLQQLEEQRKQIEQQQQLVAEQQKQIADHQKLIQEQDKQREEEFRKNSQNNQGQPIQQDNLEEEDRTLIEKMKQDRDQRQREQDQREQQFQLQVQQQQQEQQRLQIEQQRKQIQQQFAFQKQQTLQEQEEQQRQQKIQTQFQQQINTNKKQLQSEALPRIQTVQIFQDQPVEFDQTVSQLKQDRDQRQKQQDEREQQFQLQVQQQQQEQQRLQIEQQRKQIQQQFAFQKQQALQEQQEQQRQQKIQSQFQQQLKQQQQPQPAQQLPSSLRIVQPTQLEEDQLTSKMKQERDQRQREQDQREQQFQLQVQQQQQEQQRLQIEQQRKLIQQQFAFQKQQTLQEQEEQQRQQKIQTQFQQQINTNKQQLPQSFRSIQPDETETSIPIASLNQGFTAGSVLNTQPTPKVAFSKSSNLYFKPTFSSIRKQPLFRSA